MTDPAPEKCGDCHHFHASPKKGEMGTCWRYPPTALSIPVPAAKNAIETPHAPRTAGIMTMPVRPPVTAETAACGEMELPAEPGKIPVYPGSAAGLDEYGDPVKPGGAA